MLRTRYFECPDCRGMFGFQQHLSDERLPNFCPICGNRMSGEPDPVFVPAAPHIAKSIRKTADQVYRQMEQAGADHAVMAAELAGGEPSDYAAQKITDLADYLRPSEIAAKIPENPVGKFMNEAKVGGFIGMSGAEYAAGTTQGAFPRRGDATRQDLVAGHQARARVMEGAGRISRSK